MSLKNVLIAMNFFIFLPFFLNHRMRLAFYRRDSNWPYNVLFPKWSKRTFKIHRSSDQQDLQLSLFGKTLCSILGLRWGLDRSTIRRSESWLGAYNWLGNKSVANIGKHKKKNSGWTTTLDWRQKNKWISSLDSFNVVVGPLIIIK